MGGGIFLIIISKMYVFNIWLKNSVTRKYKLSHVKVNGPNSNNETIKTDFMLRKLNPCQTLKIYPKEHFENLVNLARDKIGWKALFLTSGHIGRKNQRKLE